MDVAVLGLGYVGCVSAACLARDGHRVVGVDVDAEKVAMINAGRAPVLEPGLQELVAAMVEQGQLSAVTDAGRALGECELALICVGTPDLGHGQQDLEALAHIADDIGRSLQSRTMPLTIVLRSTVLPGTTERLFARVLAGCADARPHVQVAMNPEFMREGSSLDDFRHPPFVVVGCQDADTAARLRQLYHRVEAPFVHTTITTAEMVKYVCNAFHALKIAFANEIGDLCDALGADAQEVMRIARSDTKLNASAAYLTPGFAFGGSCLPKDLRALRAAGRVSDVAVPLIDAVITANEGVVRRAVDAVLATRRRRIGIVGLAFKPTTDDLRESPMVALAEALIGKGCDVSIYDPIVVLARLRGANRRYLETEMPHISSLLCEDVDALLTRSDVLVFGAAGTRATDVRAAATSRHTIVDLTHGALGHDIGSPSGAKQVRVRA